MEVVEVDVLATVVEVVVHGDGSGSSGSRFVDVRGHNEELDASLKLASEESRVVVHESWSNMMYRYMVLRRR